MSNVKELTACAATGPVKLKAKLPNPSNSPPLPTENPLGRLVESIPESPVPLKPIAPFPAPLPNTPNPASIVTVTWISSLDPEPTVVRSMCPTLQRPVVFHCESCSVTESAFARGAHAKANRKATPAIPPRNFFTKPPHPDNLQNPSLWEGSNRRTRVRIYSDIFSTSVSLCLYVCCEASNASSITRTASSDTQTVSHFRFSV